MRHAWLACGLLACGQPVLPPVDCTFLPSALPAVGGGAVAAADFDGDGKLDLVAVGTPGQFSDAFQLEIRRGNGDGTFAHTQDVADPKWLGAWSIEVADFDRDSIPDLAIWSSDSVDDPNA